MVGSYALSLLGVRLLTALAGYDSRIFTFDATRRTLNLLNAAWLSFILVPPLVLIGLRLRARQ
jgi:hypothetical protein